MVKNITWNSDIQQACGKTIFTIYFIPTLTYRAQIWTLDKKCNRKTLASEMTFPTTTEFSEL
jgi:hypothetical protein